MLHPAANSHPAPHINGFFWPLLQPTATPRPHINGFLWASKSAVFCRLPALLQPAGSPGHTSILSYGRPSLPFARPKTLQTLQTLKTLQTLNNRKTLPFASPQICRFLPFASPLAANRQPGPHINTFLWASKSAVCPP